MRELQCEKMNLLNLCITYKKEFMKRNLIYLSLVALALFSLQSCYTTSYGTIYNIGLSSVESPADAKKQFGETKVVNYLDDEDNISKYKYEDDFVDMVWYVTNERFMFDLKNKTKYSIKINWDEVTYVDANGEAKRVIHQGVKYTNRNDTQAITTIPRGAKVSDFLVPTDNIVYSSNIGWYETNIIPVSFSTREKAENSLDKYKGEKMSILMPLQIENIQNDYIFEFEIGNDAKVEEQKELDIVNTTYASTILGTLLGTLLILMML